MNLILNGKRVEISGMDVIVTYDQIVHQVGNSPSIYPSVTYRHAGSDGNQEGILVPGESVKVNEKSVINCYDTSNA